MKNKIALLAVSGPLWSDLGGTVYEQGGFSFICSEAKRWLNPKCTSCRFEVFSQPVKGSRRIFLCERQGCVWWIKSPEDLSGNVFNPMAHFLRNHLELTPTPQQFYVRLK